MARRQLLSDEENTALLGDDFLWDRAAAPRIDVGRSGWDRDG